MNFGVHADYVNVDIIHHHSKSRDINAVLRQKYL
jgi:hypothetical protein